MKRKATALLVAAVKPMSADKDARRREFILNVILLGLLLVSIAALAASLVAMFTQQNRVGPVPVATTALFTGLIIGCRWAVRRGYVQAVSLLLVGMLLLVSANLAITWGFELPQASLTAVMAIVVAGILLGPRVGLLAAISVAGLYVLIAAVQLAGLVAPDASWHARPPVMVDAIGFGLVLSVVALVAWLSNRQAWRYMQRLQDSEAALIKERDNLEKAVAERTREIKQMQMIRIMELERFALYGRLSAALVHEISSPIMAAKLNLERLDPAALEGLTEVSTNLSRVEDRLRTARRQLGSRGETIDFAVAEELQQVRDVMRPIARKRRVKLTIHDTSELVLCGEPAKFNQIVCNLVMNAIEAFPETASGTRQVEATAARHNDTVRLTVTDNGPGIKKQLRARVFEPFFSQKPAADGYRGMGIGLVIVKQFVEDDFGGTIEVSSRVGKGTTFVVELPLVAQAKEKAAGRSPAAFTG